MTQSGEGWIPAAIAAATDRCHYDVAAHVDGELTTFNPLHDDLRPAALPRLTGGDIAAQKEAAIERRTCAPRERRRTIAAKLSVPLWPKRRF